MKKKRLLTLCKTAISPMRAYCVYTRPLSTRKMNRNYIPKFKYRRIMKKDSDFTSLASEIEQIEADWVSTKSSKIINELKLYDNTGSSVTTYITTNQPSYSKKVNYNPETKITSTESIRIREKGYYKFVDITMQFEPHENDSITIVTEDENINRLRKLNNQFNLNKNIDFDTANLKTEEIIINVCHDIAQELKLQPCTISILKLQSHFIDSKPIHIYNSVIKIFAQIANLSEATIKLKMESKLKSYKFLFSEMNIQSIEFLRSDNTQNHEGLRMIWYNNEINPIAQSVGRIDSSSLVAKELREIFVQSEESNIVSMCNPIYRDAIVFRGNNNSIIGFLNICHECNKIESHNRTEMPVTKELINKLQDVNPVDNRR